MCSNNCKCASNGVPDEKRVKLNAIIEKYKNTKGALMQVLHEAQEVYGYLPLSVQKIISEGLNIPVAEIYGVITFYTQFSLNPKGKYKIQVCIGTACYVKGSGAILEEFKNELGIDVGECTKDCKFSLDGCRCIGACGLAPVVTVNDEVYGRLTKDDVKKILAKYND